MELSLEKMEDLTRPMGALVSYLQAKFVFCNSANNDEPFGNSATLFLCDILTYESSEVIKNTTIAFLLSDKRFSIHDPLVEIQQIAQNIFFYGRVDRRELLSLNHFCKILLQYFMLAKSIRIRIANENKKEAVFIH